MHHGRDLQESYLDTLLESHTAQVSQVDFSSPGKARSIVNAWGDFWTFGAVPSFIPRGVIDRETALVLTNAAAFRAVWATPFAPQDTRYGIFTRPDGSCATVPMMTQVVAAGYANHKGVQVVELPLADAERSMVLLVPDAGAFDAFTTALDAEALAALLQQMQTTPLRLSMPRFSFGSDLQLGAALKALGMVDAFGNADFSGIDGTQELFIREVCHSTAIRVDETGAEVAAGSGVVGSIKGEAPQELQLDRPFVFLIRDVQSGTVLFLGHLVSPG
jgi:serpin B